MVYSTDACDISLDTVRWSVLSTDPIGGGNNNGPSTRKIPVAKPNLNNFDDISKIRNRDDKRIVFATDADESLRDFYWKYDRGLAKVDSTPFEITTPAAVVDTFTQAERYHIAGGKNMYELTFSNKGGLLMPIIVEWTFKDGSKEIDRVPVQVWRKNENKVTKTFMKDKEVASILLDPMRETADINTANNGWPVKVEPSKFQLFKGGGGRGPRGGGGMGGGTNPMQKEIKN